MHIHQSPTPDEVLRTLADRIEALATEPTPGAIAWPTGRTVVGLYGLLRKRHESSPRPWSAREHLPLDDYEGLPAGDDRSFLTWLHRHWFDAADLGPGRVNAWPAAHDPATQAHTTLQRTSGLHLAILGLGANGHVAFNEPGSARESTVRRVALAPETRAAALGDFQGESARVPTHAWTLGIAELRSARHVLLVALGAAKAPAVHAMLHGPVGSHCPASWLRDHPGFEVYLDEAAAGAR
ncbi:MAG: 6-phosphogluconolactonase [Planctomycetota bacterium]